MIACEITSCLPPASQMEITSASASVLETASPKSSQRLMASGTAWSMGRPAARL